MFTGLPPSRTRFSLTVDGRLCLLNRAPAALAGSAAVPRTALEGLKKVHRLSQDQDRQRRDPTLSSVHNTVAGADTTIAVGRVDTIVAVVAGWGMDSGTGTTAAVKNVAAQGIAGAVGTVASCCAAGIVSHCKGCCCSMAPSLLPCHRERRMGPLQMDQAQKDL